MDGDGNICFVVGRRPGICREAQRTFVLLMSLISPAWKHVNQIIMPEALSQHAVGIVQIRVWCRVRLSMEMVRIALVFPFSSDPGIHDRLQFQMVSYSRKPNALSLPWNADWSHRSARADESNNFVSTHRASVGLR
jgi:hypothetical protein